MVAAQFATVAELRGPAEQARLVGKTGAAAGGVPGRPHPERSVIAETHDDDPDRSVVVGARLDSVGTGPGINDNGSGSAALIEFARGCAAFYPKNKIRFIWFSAEESGLLGSQACIAGLPRGSGRKVAAMSLRHDRLAELRQTSSMRRSIGSPAIRDAVFAPQKRPFSATIKEIFLDYFSQQIPSLPTEFDRRSDYGPFIATASRPAVSSRGGGHQDPEQATIFGGTAVSRATPC